MDSVSEAPASFEFGRFRILPQRREVFADGRLLELGGRAFDVLVALIEAQGAVVSKDERPFGEACDGGLAGRGPLFQGNAVDEARRGRCWIAASPHCSRRASR